MGHKKNKYHHRVPSSTKSENGSDNKKKPKPYQPRIESNEELIHQMLQVEQLLSVSHEKLNKAEHHCYLLSTAWLHSWKEYTGYFDYQRGTIQLDHRSGSVEGIFVWPVPSRASEQRYH